MAENPAGQQHLPGGGEAYRPGLTPSAPVTVEGNDNEDENELDQNHHHAKKSVLAKVKEKAIKWKHTLAKKRHGRDEKDNETPTWEGSLDEEEDEEEDPEYHGAPMYESEMAPDTYQESSPRQTTTDELKKPSAHETNSPNANHNTNEESAPISSNERKEALLYHTNNPNTTSRPGTQLTTPESPNARKDSPLQHTNSPSAPNRPVSKELAMKRADQLSMHYLDEFKTSTPRSTATRAITDDHVPEINATNGEYHASEAEAAHKDNHASETKLAHKEDDVLEGGASIEGVLEDGGRKVTQEIPADANERGLVIKAADTDPVEEHGSNKSFAETVTEVLAPACAMVSEATHAIASKIQRPSPEDEMGAKMTYDKGVSVKKYLMHKLEPGEDERALSEVITEAMSPRKTAETGETGVVEKVRNAVSALLGKEETKGSPIPVSTNPHAVEVEEPEGRRLQAYAN